MNADASQQLIEQVRELARGPFRERAAAADREGELAIDNFNELAELGVPGLLISETFGGLEADGETYIRLIEEIAYGDASTAVALNMHLLVTSIAGALPPYPHRDEVLKACAGDAWCCAPGSIPSRELDNTSTGFAATEDGADLIISGRAGFASGADAAQFAMVGALIERPTEPDLVIALPEFNQEAITNRANWDGMGLRSNRLARCRDRRPQAASRRLLRCPALAAAHGRADDPATPVATPRAAWARHLRDLVGQRPGDVR